MWKWNPLVRTSIALVFKISMGYLFKIKFICVVLFCCPAMLAIAAQVIKPVCVFILRNAVITYCSDSPMEIS